MSWDPEAALQQERDGTRERLHELVGDYTGIEEASSGSNADDEHDPEGSTIAFERSQVGALVDQARRHLAEVDAALARVQDGTYGVCADCGRAIAPERLEARPVASSCITCASRRR